jgi:hypothetical protein
MQGFSDNIQELATESATAANEDLRQAVNSALMEALDNELMQSDTLNELWSIFRNALRDFQHAVFMDAMTDSIRNELYGRIWNAEYPALRAEAVSNIMKDNEDELIEEALEQIKEESEFDEDLSNRLHEKLKEEMKPTVADELKKELMQDEAFLESVKTELKRSILGL